MGNITSIQQSDPQSTIRKKVHLNVKHKGKAPETPGESRRLGSFSDSGTSRLIELNRLTKDELG